MPNCADEFGTLKIESGRLGRRVLEGRFDDGGMTSDTGVVLLDVLDRKKGLLKSAENYIADRCNSLLIKHNVVDRFSQILLLGWGPKQRQTGRRLP